MEAALQLKRIDRTVRSGLDDSIRGRRNPPRSWFVRATDRVVPLCGFDPSNEALDDHSCVVDVGHDEFCFGSEGPVPVGP
jgi:hypothetical protein